MQENKPGIMEGGPPCQLPGTGLQKQQELIIKAIAERLAHLCCELYPAPVGAEEEQASQRLHSLAGAAPKLLTMLAEPWFGRINRRGLKIILACTDIHMFSRILDDAVDEGAACQRQALLMAHDFHWRAVQFLARIRPALNRQSSNLISETINEAARERPEPCAWAAKNRHLLLMPLYLCRNIGDFLRARPQLETAIALLQAEDELEQNAPCPIPGYCELIGRAAKASLWLDRYGWRRLAQRLIKGSSNLLQSLEKR